MRLAFVLAGLGLIGCGYVGPVLPPALNIPEPITDVDGTQRGDRLHLTFSLPTLTSEGLTIDKRGEIEVRVGPSPEGAFNADAWAASALRVEASADHAAVKVDAPVAEFAGRQVFAGVRTASPKGRWSAWSNFLSIDIVTPLVKPVVRADSVVDGAKLTWQGRAPSYRVFRRGEKEEAFTEIGQGNGAEFVDNKAEFGKTYQYQVQLVQKAGEREAESEISDAIAFTPEDTFAPGVPTGLSALVGVSTVELAWERNLEKDFRSYRVWRATADQAFHPVAENVDSPAFSDKEIEKGKSYRYVVSAVDQLGNESPRSEEAKVTIP
jgi:hypothetical protein